MRSRRPETTVETATLKRPLEGPRFLAPALQGDLKPSGQPGWQSNGGASRGHPAKSLPFSLEASIPSDRGPLLRIFLVGVFALYADAQNEAAGTLGANIQLDDGREIVHRIDLVNGRHYSDAQILEPVLRVAGDGSSVETVGETMVGDQRYRVDLITVDVPEGLSVDKMRFRDLGSPASFVVYDVFFEFEQPAGCPFRSGAGRVSLSELGAVIRVGDRVKFLKALDQLEGSLQMAEDVDEARGLALTFLAVVTAATLELGGPKSLHKEQLDAARALERLSTADQIYRETRGRVEEIAAVFFAEQAGPSSHLIDRALAIIERNYAKPLTDSSVSAQLGLSTSHFRYLFRQATGQPFHKYLIAVRLEKARRLLIDAEMPVSQVAAAVGFTGLSHFSRAFSQRFSVSPTSVRRNAG